MQLDVAQRHQQRPERQGLMRTAFGSRGLFVLALLLMAMLADAQPTFAAPALHPAPSVIHDYIITLTPHQLQVVSYLRISAELVPEVYRQIDSDHDGRTSPVELATWMRQHPGRLQLALDGHALQPDLSIASSLSRQDLLVSNVYPIVVTATVALATALEGKHRIQLTYGDSYLSYDEYYISVGDDTANDAAPHPVMRPQYPATYQVLYHIPAADYAGPLTTGQLAPGPWTAGATQPQAAAPAGTTQGQLLDALRGWRGEWWPGLGMLLLAMALGALHALTPGHGKTMVAAYLVGTRGRIRDAAFLGGAVTLTHTLGVIVLGLGLLLLSNASLPRALQPTLELISGLLVLVLGAYLFIERWRAYSPVFRSSSAARQRTTLPVRALAPEAGAGAFPPAHAPGQMQASSRALPSGLDPHLTGHAHVHDGLHHDHDQHPHVHLPYGDTDRPHWRTLAGLGISGGLVPCPDALAILLLAAGIGQLGLGLGLVTAFSAGLAIALIGMGVALVTMRGALERRTKTRLVMNPLWTRGVPLVSAAVVILVGLLMAGAALTAL